MILSANSIDHATLTLGAMQAGVPATPVSVAYSLMSTDHAKIAHIRDLVEPAMVYADDGAKYATALAVAAANGAEVVVGKNPPGGVEATLFEDLLASVPGDAVEQAFAAVGPDTIAKYLFTSGSTGRPKGVINLQRMLCANQQKIAQIRPPNAEDPPTLLDWLPWNHTYGGNYNVNYVIRNQGTMYIDAGRPLPGIFDLTIGNLREVSPTVYFGVPAGYAILIPLLENDPQLCESFFRNLKLAGYGGASLPDDLWQRLTALSVKTTGKRVMLLTGWGSTETAPTATSLYWEVDRPGVIGLPLPGIQIKMVPAGTKMELRIKGRSTWKDIIRSAMPAAWKIPTTPPRAFASTAAWSRISNSRPEPGCMSARCGLPPSKRRARLSRTPWSPATTAPTSACSPGPILPLAANSPAIQSNNCRSNN